MYLDIVYAYINKIIRNIQMLLYAEFLLDDTRCVFSKHMIPYNREISIPSASI